jgi:hypothetical protein
MASQVRASSIDRIAELLGIASRQRFTAMLPGNRFHCLLDELPFHLIPSRALDREQAHCLLSQSLFLNPLCSVLPAGHVPTELQSHAELTAGFALECPIAWVSDPGVGTISAFWLGPKFEAVVSNLCMGGPAPRSLHDNVKLLLAIAGILIPDGYIEKRRAEWSEISRSRSRMFQETNYAPISDLIHPFSLAALRRYYRHQIRRGAVRLGDEQSSRRYVAHNEPVARYFHHQMASTVSAIVGEVVKPSYVYFASYLGGAELKKHTDRQQCEYSVTLCLDFSPEPEQETSWPICLDTPRGTVSVYQGLGDGLVYRGTKLPHYRNVLAEGYTSTSIFFHYVPAEFSGPLE